MSIKLHDTEFTLEQIKKNNSYIRLGDGEFRILSGHRCATPFQSLQSELINKLKLLIIEINENQFENLNIGVDMHQIKKEWFKKYIDDNIKIKKIHTFIRLKPYLIPIITKKKIVYISSYIDKVLDDVNIDDIDFSKVLTTYTTKDINIIKIKSYIHKYNYSTESINTVINRFNKCIKNNVSKSNYISINKECIAIIHAIKLTKLKSHIDRLFQKSRVKCVTYIQTNFRENFNQYDLILKECINKTSDNDIFIFGCGPTGKCIIYDMIKQGHKNLCLDMGKII